MLKYILIVFGIILVIALVVQIIKGIAGFIFEFFRYLFPLAIIAFGVWVYFDSTRFYMLPTGASYASVILGVVVLLISILTSPEMKFKRRMKRENKVKKSFIDNCLAKVKALGACTIDEYFDEFSDDLDMLSKVKIHKDASSNIRAIKTVCESALSSIYDLERIKLDNGEYLFINPEGGKYFRREEIEID